MIHSRRLRVGSRLRQGACASAGRLRSGKSCCVWVTDRGVLAVSYVLLAVA
jgi:hypothetical protein